MMICLQGGRYRRYRFLVRPLRASVLKEGRFDPGGSLAFASDTCRYDKTLADRRFFSVRLFSYSIRRLSPIAARIEASLGRPASNRLAHLHLPLPVTARTINLLSPFPFNSRLFSTFVAFTADMPSMLPLLSASFIVALRLILSLHTSPVDQVAVSISSKGFHMCLLRHWLC
jgi:hypothetical protein